jgi:hypothetical protein
MRHDYEVVLTHKDGSVRNFHLYGQAPPDNGDIISLPVDGQVIKARVSDRSQGSEMVRSVNHTDAMEI